MPHLALRVWLGEVEDVVGEGAAATIFGSDVIAIVVADT